MFKKFSITLAIILLMALTLQTAVMAAVLEVDTANPAFKSDTWELTADYEYSIDKAFSTTHTRGAGDGSQVQRFCANIEDGAASVEGQLSFLNGSAINNAVFPFKETVRIDSVTWKWNNGGRQYFLLLYTSMDGQNWTEIEITGNAKKVTVANTYDTTGGLGGPSVECYATTPAGIADDDDVNPITFTFKQTVPAKYFKIVMFGNDGESGDLAVSHPWVSFNNMKFEGSVYVEEVAAPVEAPAVTAVETPAPVVAAPVVAAPAANAAAPRTSDTSVIIFIVLAAISLVGASIVVFKRRNFVK